MMQMLSGFSTTPSAGRLSEFLKVSLQGKNVILMGTAKRLQDTRRDATVDCIPVPHEMSLLKPCRSVCLQDDVCGFRAKT